MPLSLWEFILFLPLHQLGPVYEDPDAFKVDPYTQDNLAYGHIQQSAQLKGPIYEDIKPDPHTQGNLAYGHVQFNWFKTVSLVHYFHLL